MDSSQHVGPRFYLIMYTQDGSGPRGGSRIDGSVQTLLGRKKGPFIHQVSGSTRDSLKKSELEDALKRKKHFLKSDHVGSLLGCSARLGSAQ